MANNSIKGNLVMVKRLSKRVPKTINEALHFNEEDDMMPQDDTQDMRHNYSQYQRDDASMRSDDMSPEELINDIRKKALCAMAKLADTPDDTNYEILKRIWTFCDRAMSDKQEGQDSHSNDNKRR